MDNLDYYRIEKAIKFLENNILVQPSLEEIAEHVGLSEFHFQRMFKKWAGISPKKFLQFLTIEYTKNILDQTKNIFDATYESGLSSISRLHDLFVNIEAITPAEYKSKGKDLVIYYGHHESLFGKCLIGVTEKGICALYFGNENSDIDTLADLRLRWPNSQIIQDQSKTKVYLDQIFSVNKKNRINIFLKGTNFQIQVWKALLTIPEGQLLTYEEVARKIKNPKALRAVGTAIGSNPISYLIPCHRVINKIGVVGNYRWGRSRKYAMIGYEAVKLIS